MIGVSGGSDSTCLVHLFKQAGYDIGLAHCNYHMRGIDSDKDQTFIEELAQQLDIPCFICSFTENTSTNDASFQMIARDFRYAFFEEIRSGHSYDWIATAHHLDDNIETSLKHWIEGCGVKGLRGIPSKRDNIIRPLLQFSKVELLEYLKTHHLAYRHDVTNDQTKYKRNQIRHSLIPLIQDIEPGFVKNMRYNLQRMNELEAIESTYVKQHLQTLYKQEEDGIHIQINALEATVAPMRLLVEILKPFHFTTGQIEQIFKTRHHTSGAIFSSSVARLLRDRNRFIIQQIDTQQRDPMEIHSLDDVQLTWGNDQLISNTSPINTNYTTQISLRSKDLIFPLTLRNRKTSDFFYPKGMDGKKKVSKFMKDRKLNQFTKEKIPILVNGNGDIIWILGYIQDKRYSDMQHAEKVYYLKYTKL